MSAMASKETTEGGIPKTASQTVRLIYAYLRVLAAGILCGSTVAHASTGF